MAFQEYYDVYLKAQKNLQAPYYVVSFDIVGSSKLPPQDRQQLNYNMMVIMKYVYNKFLEKEKELNKQVVIKDERFHTPWSNDITAGNYIDPILLGDSFFFTVLRDTITKEEIIKLVNEIKDKLNMKEEFHIADSYYETNNYEEGNKKLYRGYCLQILEKLHKREVEEELEETRRIM